MTYAQLKTDIAGYLKRDDLTAVIPSFITLAHADVDVDVRGHIREDDVSLAVTDGQAELPCDVRAIKNVYFDGLALTPMDRKAFDGIALNDSLPRFYRVVNGNIDVWPTGATSNLRLVYEKALPVLEQDDDTNEVLDRFPAIYLYGALLHAEPFLIADERIATWAALYRAAVSKANDAMMREALPAGLQMRPSAAVV